MPGFGKNASSKLVSLHELTGSSCSRHIRFFFIFNSHPDPFLLIPS